MEVQEIRFDDDFIKNTVTEIDKKEAELNDKREKMSSGVHDLYLQKIDIDNDDKGKIFIRVITNIDKDAATFRDLKRNFTFNTNFKEDDAEAKKKLVQAQTMFLEFFYKAFKYTFKPGTLIALVKQAQQFEGKQLKAAVQRRQEIKKHYRKGNPTDVAAISILDICDIWYVGRIDDETFSMKEDKEFKPLKKEDKEEFDDFVHLNPDLYEDGKLKENVLKDIYSSSGSDDDTTEASDTAKQAAMAFGTTTAEEDAKADEIFGAEPVKDEAKKPAKTTTIKTAAKPKPEPKAEAKIEPTAETPAPDDWDWK